MLSQGRNGNNNRSTVFHQLQHRSHQLHQPSYVLQQLQGSPDSCIQNLVCAGCVLVVCVLFMLCFCCVCVVCVLVFFSAVFLLLSLSVVFLSVVCEVVFACLSFDKP
eukprot:GHVS01002326.1.p1 GENE.GHVS01002326.1~~GHVS01002326.1.p1  ORF type:complete len:107 (-),score=22.66 GHVS01002326.1:74-394(-)